MNSRLGHIRPILREVSKIWSATDMVRLYISVLQMTTIFQISFCFIRKIVSKIKIHGKGSVEQI
jgi:hypothetical protein